MDTTWKKEARTAKDDVATNSDGRAEGHVLEIHTVKMRLVPACYTSGRGISLNRALFQLRGVRLASAKAEPCGERLLWPYVPLGTKRKSK